MSSDHPTSPRPGVILYRYLAAEMLLPTCLALGGFTLVVLTKDFTGYSELVINRGAGLARVGRIVLFQALPLMSQMLPFAVLVGVLVGLGRLAEDLEILVISALGIEPRRLIGPVALFGSAAAVVGLALALFVAPWAQRGADRSLREIAEINPAAEIQPGVVSRFGDWKLEAREVVDEGQTLRRVLLWMPSVGETVFAKTAQLEANPESGLQITLTNGALLLNTRKSPSAMHFQELSTALPSGTELAQASLQDELAGMSLSQLSALSSEAAEGKRSLAARSQLHRRFVLPMAVALFGALALPLALARSRTSRSGGAVLGLGIAIAYYGLLQLAEGISQRAPELSLPAAWLPNTILLVLTLVLYGRLSKPLSAGRPVSLRGPRKRRRTGGRRRQAGGIRARRAALPRYVAARFLQLSLICFAALVAAYLLVDILERLQWFARHAATFDEILRFYAARIPLLVSRVVPMGLVVAMALTVSLLTSQGELLGMRSLGISAPHALRPALLACFLVVPLSFLLNDQIVPQTNELADLIKQRDIKSAGDERTAVWNTNGGSLYQLASLDTSLGRADEIVIYELGPGGLPVSRIDARSARYTGKGLWRLRGATGAEMDAAGKLLSAVPARYVDLGEQPSDELDLMHLSVSDVRQLVRDFAAVGDSTTAFEVDLHLKLATPLACLLLPALVLIFAVNGPPFPSTTLTLILAGALAVGYTLSTGTFASFGRSGVLPAWAGGWGPNLLAVLILTWLALRTRLGRRGQSQ